MDFCSMGIHKRTAENLAPNGACKPCARVTRKRRAGASICWTGEHPEPADGYICECGEQPPASDFLDWAMIEDAVVGRRLFRPMTNAETVSAIRTVQSRSHGLYGPYEAGEMLGIPAGRVRYLVYESDMYREVPDATGVFLADVERMSA